jgi:hypothetical protein
VSFVYRMFCRIVELLVLRSRRERSKDVEPTAIGLDPIVRVPLGVVEPAGHELFDSR